MKKISSSILMFITLLYGGCKDASLESYLNQKQAPTVEPTQQKSVLDGWKPDFSQFSQRAKQKLGEFKFNSLIKECEDKFKDYKYDDINLRPDLPSELDDIYTSARKLIYQSKFNEKYGHSTEVVVTVAKTFLNRFKEEYKEEKNCKFEGPPLWNMIEDINFTFPK